ncbi:hypothetical protein [Croceimicrobium hydrocarbonivorans]|uniref:Uncharacterized protein n=1 Tax=Croceimicrobium hydrocarbonivorans TaxID=2761580 RepID=A0A7H0VJ69_9FLAO|nr:hypothetical protein [Croceimicrobium hydrocarbonivorans]QNR25767.1 hypothetical protein H4K34_07965 [Croceimicrobium hydrocarbonivorans]
MSLKKIYIYSMLFLTSISFIACEKGEADNGSTVLYEEFSAFINDEYWSKNPGVGCFSLIKVYTKEANSYGNNPRGYLAIVATDCPTDNVMSLVIDSVDQEGKYIFNSSDTLSAYMDWKSRELDTLEVYPIEYYRYRAVSGWLRIEQLRPAYYDTISPPEKAQNRPGWIEGSFEMVLVNNISKTPPGTIQDTLHIRDGKFAAIL